MLTVIKFSLTLIESEEIPNIETATQKNSART